MTNPRSNLIESSDSHEIELNFESWMDLLYTDRFSERDELLFIKGLKDHPEWLNQSDHFGQTPLIMACCEQEERMINVLIKEGANINHQDGEGLTALMYAARSGNLEIFRSIYQAGADLNLQNKEGQTAFIIASLFGHEEIVQALIQEGMDPNHHDTEGWTALMHASKLGQLECVKVLLEAGADPGKVNLRRKTALDVAKEYHNDIIISFLEAYLSEETMNQMIRKCGQFHPSDFKASKPRL